MSPSGSGHIRRFGEDQPSPIGIASRRGRWCGSSGIAAPVIAGRLVAKGILADFEGRGRGAWMAMRPVHSGGAMMEVRSTLDHLWSWFRKPSRFKSEAALLVPTGLELGRRVRVGYSRPRPDRGRDRPSVRKRGPTVGPSRRRDRQGTSRPRQEPMITANHRGQPSTDGQDWSDSLVSECD